MEANNLKPCYQCGVKKPAVSFAVRASSCDGRSGLCNSCVSFNYKATKKGFISKVYCAQRKASRQRGHVMPDYLLDELREWAFNQSVFHKLFNEWVASGFVKSLVPSFDRKDDYKPYSLDNIQIMTWRENGDKNYRDIKNGVNNKNSKAVVQMTRAGNFVSEYHSTSHAERETGAFHNHISQCCRGKRKTTGGYRWMYSINTNIINNQI